MFWIAGFALLCATIVQAVRSRPRSPRRMPRPTGAQLSTLLAWLIIALLAATVAFRHA